MNPLTRDTDKQENLMSTSTRTFIGAVIAAGAVALVAGAPREIPQPLLALTFLAAMLVVSLFKLRIPLGHGQATLCMAYVVDFAVLVTSGAELAMVIAAVGVLVQCTINVRRRQPWYRTAFSVAAVVLAVRSAGFIWEATGGSSASGLAIVLPLAAAAVPYFAINSGLVATAIALSNGLNPFRCWRENFLRTAPSCFVAAGVVASATVALTPDAYLLLVAVALPMAITHAAHAQWFRRVAERMAYQPRVVAV
jgi:hypothetical protein